eukprot:TRINITY_DN3455_c0_g1_i2.p1 TRINITY_DN3455_c0_g1~~TRINITY_DN3455_c0_g1_i2.p1  ORF type:complete len:422 (-),score=54.62 TRINITY_DN3455_c0_g1_i2:68-1276(-)
MSFLACPNAVFAASNIWKLLLSLVLLSIVTAAAATGTDDVAELAKSTETGKKKQKFTLLTYMNSFDSKYAYLQISAAHHKIWPKILGYGEIAYWPDGLGVKINALRNYVHEEVDDNELVLFVDAFDVMIFASKEEIISKFEELEESTKRSIFFNAEDLCFPAFSEICNDKYPESPHKQWRYLNSGVLIGRGRSLKVMLKDSVPDVIPGSDQAWYHRYFLSHPDLVGRDLTCKVVCSTQSLGKGQDLEFKDGRIQNTVTGEKPAALHFVGAGHWRIWKDGRPTTLIQDVFMSLYPSVGDRFFGSIDVVMQIGTTHTNKLLSLRGSSKEAYFALMRTILCFQCLFGGTSDDCRYVNGFFCDTCSEFRCTSLAITMISIFFFVLKRKSRECRVSSPVTQEPFKQS